MAVSSAAVFAFFSLFATANAALRVACYYRSEAVYVTPPADFQPSDINVEICTHVFYTFAVLNNATHHMESPDPTNDLSSTEHGRNDNYRNTVALKQRNPELKVLISIGGWNEGSLKYSQMAASPVYRHVFIDSVISYMDTFGFDGLDLDWEYPADRGGGEEDVENFITLLQEISDRFRNYTTRQLLLSVALGAGKYTIDNSYLVPNISNIVDFINVMSYDYHSYSAENPALGHVAPLYGQLGDDETLSVDWSISYYLQLGAPAEKINLGMPLYGHTYALADPEKHGFNDSAVGPGNPGPYSKTPGTLNYYEICMDIRNDWTVVYDETTQVPYTYKDDQWIGYDDPVSISSKVTYALDRGLGGVMVWSVDGDSCLVTCWGEPRCSLLSAIYATARLYDVKNRG